jgi:hypothetical protein
VIIGQARARWIVAVTSRVKRRLGDTRIVPCGRRFPAGRAEADRAIIGLTIPDGHLFAVPAPPEAWSP